MDSVTAAVPSSYEVAEWWITNLKDVFTIVAIILGGLWTYFLFIRKRTLRPCPRFGHKITHVRLPENRTLLRLTVIVENKGASLVRFGCVKSWVQQVTPLHEVMASEFSRTDTNDDKRVERNLDWPRIGVFKASAEKMREYRVEPGETEEFHYDFVVKSSVTSALVYTHFEEYGKKRRGWNKTTLYRFEGSDSSVPGPSSASPRMPAEPDSKGAIPA
jgi:hypothetical protein